MPLPPSDFMNLLPQAEPVPANPGPVYYLWVFDPQSGKVTVTHNDDRPRQDAMTHGDLANLVVHPDRVHGYAYPIRDGVRITDWEHRPITDPFVTRQVQEEIKKLRK